MSDSMIQEAAIFRDIAAGDAPAGEALARAVGWPHRAEDFAMVIALGHGLVATMAGETVAVGMWWPYGEKHATLGQIIVSPAHQGGGLGRRLMQGLLAQAGDRSVMLNATAAGQPLYEKLGFVPCGGISQHHGEVLAMPAHLPGAGATLRPASAFDMIELERLDRAASGLPRRALLASLLERGEGAVLERDGRAVGFSMMRRFGRGWLVGPVVAESDADARILVAHWLQGRSGQFMRVDTGTGTPLADWLTSHGLMPVSSVVTMVRGRWPQVEGPLRIYAPASQALG